MRLLHKVDTEVLDFTFLLFKKDFFKRVRLLKSTEDLAATANLTVFIRVRFECKKGLVPE